MYHHIDTEQYTNQTVSKLLVANLGYCIANTRENLVDKVRELACIFVSLHSNDCIKGQQMLQEIISDVFDNNKYIGGCASIKKYVGDDLVSFCMLKFLVPMLNAHYLYGNDLKINLVCNAFCYTNIEDFLSKDAWFRKRFNRKYRHLFNFISAYAGYMNHVNANMQKTKEELLKFTQELYKRGEIKC
ncbi:MAG: hypothetical protein RBT59_07055 [Arcobacteraceae bacterium]|jgi:hypothetical protein|nr:hypothetical protein [Arcobacteraceae bacterium]